MFTETETNDTTAITENTTSISIYPNPANDRLYIEAEGEIENVVIYDIYGRHQVTKTPSHQEMTSVNVSGLKAGIYFVKINTENGEIVKRFIKN